ncbi:MAG: hypothetical protein JO291_04795 [Acidimicrobiia bacterium]|nr:hypothetical protein [Acidimicrobiia bacterium]
MLWFVVVASPSGSVTREVADHLSSSDVSEVPARPARHHCWSAGDGTARVATWETGSEPGTVVDGGGLTAVAGRPSLRRVPVRAEVPVATTISETIRSAGWSAEDELLDAYALVAFDEAGTGFVTMDPLGFHPLFWSAVGEVTVVGNRADLVAQVAAHQSGRPAGRDVMTAAWMAFAGRPPDDRTGFEDVTLLPQYTTAHIDHGRVVKVTREPFHLCSPDLPLTDPHDIAELLTADMTSVLRQAIARSPGPPELELTGGKDSRGVLAVAVAEGLAPALVCSSYGPETLPDVQVSRAVARSCGLRHVDTSDRHFLGAWTYSLVERFERHVQRTCGTSELGLANEPPPPGPLSIAGLLGEVYRSPRDSDAFTPPRTWDEAAERFGTERRQGSLALVRPDLAASFADQALDRYLGARAQVRGPEALRVAYTLRYLLPRSLGPLTELNGHRVMPYYSPNAMRHMLRAGHQARADERVHRQLVERAGPALMAEPLANQRWRWEAGVTGPPVKGAGNVRQTAAPATLDERSQLLLDLVDGHRQSAFFEVVDVDALTDAIRGLATRRPAERVQVLGAMAGLMWLEGLERRRRVGDD